MSKEHINQLKRVCAEQMMLGRGYNDTPRDNIEWDFNHSESQASMCYDDVSNIIDFLFDAGILIDGEPDPEKEPHTHTHEHHTHQEQQDSLASQSVILTMSLTPFIWKDDSEGVPQREFHRPITMRDLRDFMDSLDRIKVLDTEELEGELWFSRDIRDTEVDRIGCGDCGQEDLLVANHFCEGHEHV